MKSSKSSENIKIDLPIEQWRKSVVGKVMTVNGLIPAESIGITMAHEHLVIKHQGTDIDLDDPDLIAEELKPFYEMGGRTLVEQSNERIGRDPLTLKSISEKTGVNIIMGSGYYKDDWMPNDVKFKTVEDIAQEICRDIVIGVGDTGIHAGHIGEIGVSRIITHNEEKSVRASARAQKETGAALSIHFDLDANEAEQEYIIGILDEEGIEFKRVVINHMVPMLDNIDRIIRLAQKGLNISFDSFGIDYESRMEKLIDTTFEEQMVTIKELLRRGLIDHLVLSQDICFKSSLIAYGGRGYARIFKEIIPFLRKLHINEFDLDRMIMHNPRKIFTLGGRFPSY